VLISQMDEQGLRTLGLQLAQGTAELGRRRGRWRVFSKDDSGAGRSGAASHLVLDKLVDVLQPEVGEARAAGQEVWQRLLDCRARHNRWRFLKKRESSVRFVHQRPNPKKNMVYGTQGDTKRCLLSWLTNSALVYEPKCGEGGVTGSRPVNTTVQYTGAKIKFGVITTYLTFISTPDSTPTHLRWATLMPESTLSPMELASGGLTGDPRLLRIFLYRMGKIKPACLFVNKLKPFNLKITKHEIFKLVCFTPKKTTWALWEGDLGRGLEKIFLA
jgi:hypothetical protein